MDNYKGANRTMTSSIASNSRKDTFNCPRESHPNIIGGDGTRSRGSRTLPYPKYVKRREEGHCFHCRGAYSYGHKCPNKNSRVVIYGEEEKLTETTKPQSGPEEDMEDWENESCDNKECQHTNLTVFSARGMT